LQLKKSFQNSATSKERRVFNMVKQNKSIDSRN
jgi:hypothetical protein